jgi:hypothetical protein
MSVRKAELKSFDSGTYTAAVRMDGGYKVDLEGIAVARNLPSAEMIAGRSVVMQYFSDTNPREAVVIAIYVPE